MLATVSGAVDRPGVYEIEVGTPVTTVQRLLGHGSLRATQRYLSLADPIVHRDYDTAMTRLLAEAQAG